MGNLQEGLQSSLLKNFSFGGLVGGGGEVDDEIHVISSHSTLRETVEKLKLNQTYIINKDFIRKKDVYNQSPIKLIVPSSIEDTLSASLRFKSTHIKNKAKLILLPVKAENLLEKSNQINFRQYYPLHTEFSHLTRHVSLNPKKIKSNYLFKRV